MSSKMTRGGTAAATQGAHHQSHHHHNHTSYQTVTNNEEFIQKLEECLPGGLPKEIRDAIVAIKQLDQRKDSR